MIVLCIYKVYLSVNRKCLGIFYKENTNNLQLWMLYILRSEIRDVLLNVIQNLKTQSFIQSSSFLHLYWMNLKEKKNKNSEILCERKKMSVFGLASYAEYIMLRFQWYVVILIGTCQNSMLLLHMSNVCTLLLKFLLAFITFVDISTFFQVGF